MEWASSIALWIRRSIVTSQSRSSPPALTSDEERRLRFRREAQAAAGLSHANIAVIHEVGEADDTPYMVMELVEGRNLRELLSEKALTLREWIRIARAMAEGLAHAHANGVVHHDLKPENVVITADGQVKILDFGLAKVLQPEALPIDDPVHTELNRRSQELTIKGTVLGTASYMSPEQARGEQVDHRSDLFSLGILLYETATGTSLFSRNTAVEALSAVLTQEALAPSSISTELPADVDRIVGKLLEKELRHRYQSAADVAAHLRNLQRDLDSGPAPIATPEEPAQFRRWALPVGITLILIVVAAIVLSRRDGSPPDQGGESAELSIAVVGFENLNDPTDTDHLGRMLMSLITTDLAESGVSRVVSTSKVLSAQRELEPEAIAFDAALAPDIARRAGATVMLVGQVGQAGERMILTAELVDVASGTTLGSHREAADSAAELFDLASTIAGEVREQLGESTTSPSSFDLARALTDSPEAYRHYAAGEIALHGFDLTEARRQFDLAVSLDATFAMAHYRRATTYSWGGGPGESVAKFEEGLPYIDRLPERWQVMYRAFMRFMEQRYDDAYQMATGLIEHDSDIPDAHYMLGEMLTHSSKYTNIRASIGHFERALAIDPTYRIVLYHLMDAYVLTRNLEAARALVARETSKGHSDPITSELEIALLAAEHNFASAMERAEQELASGSTQIASRLIEMYTASNRLTDAERVAQLLAKDGFYLSSAEGYHSLGATRVGLGRFESGIADLLESVRRYEETVGAVMAAQSLMLIAEVQATVGEGADALATIRRSIDIEPYYAPGFVVLTRFLCAEDRFQEAERSLEELRRRAEESMSPFQDYGIALMEFEMALARNDLPTARAALDQAGESGSFHRGPPKPWYAARLHVAESDPEAAIAAYEESLAPIHLFRSFDPVAVTQTFLELARLEEQTGDHDAARSHYERYLERWGDADVTLPGVVEARKRLASLSNR